MGVLITYANANPVKEEILENVKTTLAQISVVNGFYNNVAEVHRFRIAGWQAYAFPALAVIGVKEDKKGILGTPSRMDVTLILSVMCILTADAVADAEDLHNRLLCDVEAVMQLDVTRGGFAVDTTCIGDELEPIEASTPFFVSTITFEVHYRHSRSDPTVRL